MKKIVEIRNLDCAACAAELEELLNTIEGVEAAVDFINLRISLSCETEEQYARAIGTVAGFEEVEIVERGERVVRIRNLDCANCARELQEELSELDGIGNVAVDFINQRVTLSAATDKAFGRAIRLISRFEEVEIVDENAPRKKERRLKEILSIAVSACFFLPALVLEHISGVNALISQLLYYAAFAAAGWSVVLSVAKNVPKAFRKGFHGGVLLDENTLMLIASVGAFAIRQEMEGAAVMLLYQIGELLQSIAVGSSRNAISKLMSLKSDTAILIESDSRREVAPETLKADDVILIRKGDKVPADCVLTEGETECDTKSLTGESYLREVSAGDELLSGFVNEGAAVRARVIRPASESAVAKILNMVENSATQKAQPEKFITKFARYYTPIVVALAVVLAIVPPLFDGYRFSRWIVSALNFLVVSCPCALIISVPLTYFSGVGALAKIGVLAKGGVYLDTLAKVKVAAFDKTGTLTEGKFTVSAVHGDERTLPIAAAVETLSSHPLAQAFYGVATPYEASECEEIAGYGLSAAVNGRRVLVGSARLMRERGVGFKEVDTPASVVHVAEEGTYLGCIEIADAVKADAAAALAAIKREGIEKIVVLTGDSRSRAEAVAQELGADELYAELLPEQKPQIARELKKQGVLMYAGDGINDTPVMTESDLALSMGTLGSDAAIEASDMVLVSDSLAALPKAIRGAKKTRKIVLENIVFSIAVKTAFMALSVAGVLPLWLAVFGDVGVMLLAVLNSMRMRLKIK
ncbi:MAG: heavy metal translocating P-type ATPase [Candidatus Gallimonas sp.]